MALSRILSTLYDQSFCASNISGVACTLLVQLNPRVLWRSTVVHVTAALTSASQRHATRRSNFRVGSHPRVRYRKQVELEWCSVWNIRPVAISCTEY